MIPAQKSRIENLKDFLEARNISADGVDMLFDDFSQHDDETVTAPDILIAGADAIGARAEARDTPAGERVMRRSVAMFNMWRSGDSIHQVTEAEGWIFMALIKLCRANAGGHNLDDYVDGAAYIALAGEHADSLDESAF